MAANKFATMLHKNTNKITLILVYAILEWFLILFLLLNSLFSYLIVKYAEYFGLKRPCLWCTRLDHVFDSKKKKDCYRDLVCDEHATEISKLGFCSSHRRLSVSVDMCEDCSSSVSCCEVDCGELSKKYAFFPWMKQIGLIRESGEVGFENGGSSLCSCCGVSFEGLQRKLYSPYVLIQPSWEVLDYTQKGNLIKEEEDDDPQNCSGSCEEEKVKMEETEVKTEDGVKVETEKEEEEEESLKQDGDLVMELIEDQGCDQTNNENEDLGVETVQKHIEFYIEGEDFHLIPVEMMDSIKTKHTSSVGFEDVVLDFSGHDVGTQVEFVVENRSTELEEELQQQENVNVNENESEWSDFIQAESKSKEEEEHQEVVKTEDTQTPVADFVQETTGDMESKEGVESEEGEEHQQVVNGAAGDMELNKDNEVTSDDVLQLQSDEADAEISIGTEIPDHEPIDDIQPQQIAQLQPENDDHDHGDNKDLEFRTISIETRERDIESHLYEIEEEKAPDTPNSIDSLHQLHNKLLLLDRKESATEESLDGGSVFSDIDSCDTSTLTVEKLKTALRAERKALNALYTELEEERSASAVAANQTMAMINRLQEEKAAMQMEALQYQRMMEEQSEYDQEALQLLNELMVKREREKAEIEKELELYRKKVLDYETMLRRSCRNSSVSCSNAEDSDDLSIDLNHEDKEEDNQNTPTDAVLYLEESLQNFEEERLLILDQLKGLEEKLVTLNDEEEHDIKPFEHIYKENGNGYHEVNIEGNGIINGHFKEINGRLLPEKKIVVTKGKSLLPLFDAEMEDGYELELDTVASQNSSVSKNRYAYEAEVDHVYERLQALEADREFLKHCISSLRKGDKGLYVLQEILQHLRDLRNVELRAKSFDVSSA